jgi:hypothetical protein
MNIRNLLYLEIKSISSAFGIRGKSEEGRGSPLPLSYGRWFELIIIHIVFVTGEICILYSVESS